MQTLREITSDGDILDDGESSALFPFDSEALSDDPLD
jgi:hypothetical protein